VGTLADWQIKGLCEKGMVTPFDATLLNPASLDVRLGNLIYVETGDDLKLTDISKATKDNPWYLHPNEFILAQTQEEFNIPNILCATFALKSSLARTGFEHLLAGFIDPGFNNSVLTLELKNARTSKSLPLWPGMRIGQIIFQKMSKLPLKSYKESGRYNGDKQVTQCKGIL
jgi:dCTP deaminase